MEHCNGTLDQLLQDESQNNKIFINKASICIGIMEGLEYIHISRIHHGDLATRNILYSINTQNNTYTPKISGFGQSFKFLDKDGMTDNDWFRPYNAEKLRERTNRLVEKKKNEVSKFESLSGNKLLYNKLVQIQMHQQKIRTNILVSITEYGGKYVIYLL